MKIFSLIVKVIYNIKNYLVYNQFLILVHQLVRYVMPY